MNEGVNASGARNACTGLTFHWEMGSSDDEPRVLERASEEGSLSAKIRIDPA